jgi:hypothetical protein
MKHDEILKQGLRIGTTNVLLHIDDPAVHMPDFSAYPAF